MKWTIQLRSQQWAHTLRFSYMAPLFLMYTWLPTFLIWSVTLHSARNWQWLWNQTIKHCLYIVYKVQLPRFCGWLIFAPGDSYIGFSFAFTIFRFAFTNNDRSGWLFCSHNHQSEILSSDKEENHRQCVYSPLEIRRGVALCTMCTECVQNTQYWQILQQDKIDPSLKSILFMMQNQLKIFVVSR